MSGRVQPLREFRRCELRTWSKHSEDGSPCFDDRHTVSTDIGEGVVRVEVIQAWRASDRQTKFITMILPTRDAVQLVELLRDAIREAERLLPEEW